jgi:tight adherence protein C
MTTLVVIPVLTFIAVFCLGGSLVIVNFSRRKRISMRLAVAGPPPLPYEPDTPRFFIVRALAAFGSLISNKGPSAELRLRITQAGLTSPHAVPTYMGIKFSFLIFSLTLMASVASFLDTTTAIKMLIVLVGAAIAFFLPNLLLKYLADRRCSEVRRHLPDVIDLLEISVSGGMGLDTAWNAVAGEIRAVSALTADEMALTNLEVLLGAERGDAIRNMAQRTNSKELDSLVAVLVQSDRFGTSISEALRVFAQTMREVRSQRAEEYAEKMAVKMLFPMVLFIFPVVLIVAAGPAVLTLVDIFSK